MGQSTSIDTDISHHDQDGRRFLVQELETKYEDDDNEEEDDGKDNEEEGEEGTESYAPDFESLSTADDGHGLRRFEVEESGEDDMLHSESEESDGDEADEGGADVNEKNDYKAPSSSMYERGIAAMNISFASSQQEIVARDDVDGGRGGRLGGVESDLHRENDHEDEEEDNDIVDQSDQFSEPLAGQDEEDEEEGGAGGAGGYPSASERRQGGSEVVSSSTSGGGCATPHSPHSRSSPSVSTSASASVSLFPSSPSPSPSSSSSAAAVVHSQHSPSAKSPSPSLSPSPLSARLVDVNQASPSTPTLTPAGAADAVDRGSVNHCAATQQSPPRDNDFSSLCFSPPWLSPTADQRNNISTLSKNESSGGGDRQSATPAGNVTVGQDATIPHSTTPAVPVAPAVLVFPPISDTVERVGVGADIPSSSVVTHPTAIANAAAALAAEAPMHTRAGDAAAGATAATAAGARGTDSPDTAKIKGIVDSEIHRIFGEISTPERSRSTNISSSAADLVPGGVAAGVAVPAVPQLHQVVVSPQQGLSSSMSLGRVVDDSIQQSAQQWWSKMEAAQQQEQQRLLQSEASLRGISAAAAAATASAGSKGVPAKLSEAELFRRSLFQVQSLLPPTIGSTVASADGKGSSSGGSKYPGQQKQFIDAETDRVSNIMMGVFRKAAV